MTQDFPAVHFPWEGITLYQACQDQSGIRIAWENTHSSTTRSRKRNSNGDAGSRPLQRPSGLLLGQEGAPRQRGHTQGDKWEKGVVQHLCVPVDEKSSSNLEVWAGRLDGMEELSKVCRRPAWIIHTSLLGKSLASKAAEYLAMLCEAVSKLVVNVWKKTLNLEWWRYQVETKSDEVNSCRRRGW